MKPIDIVKIVVYKSITKKVERKRRGPKGYGLLRIIRLLLYAVLMEIFSTRQLVKHLKKRKKVCVQREKMEDSGRKGKDKIRFGQ